MAGAPNNCVICTMGGCTNSLAINYDSTATVDNGKCKFDTSVVVPMAVDNAKVRTGADQDGTSMQKNFFCSMRVDGCKGLGIHSTSQQTTYNNYIKGLDKYTQKTSGTCT